MGTSAGPLSLAMALDVMSGDFRYDAHDTEISSDLALPELTRSQRPELQSSINISRDDSLPLPSVEGEHRRVDAAGFHIAWGQAAAFQVSPTGQINYRRCPGVSDDLIRVPLLGAVLAAALYYRGTLVMHGNAMSIGGRGALLLGAKGQGKSTLSAALVSRGGVVHAEDAAALSFVPGQPVGISPGMRQLRLWPDAVNASLGGSPLPSRAIHELSAKRVFPLPEQEEVPRRLPLTCIYVLEAADTLEFQPLGPTEAWPLLLVHAFVARFGTEFLTGPDAARHFAACATLARTVRCVRLRRPRDFSRLDDVCAGLERDLASA